MKHFLDKIKSVKLCLMAHPDNTEGSEFADRISDLASIEDEINQHLDSWTTIKTAQDLPEEDYALYHVIAKSPIYVCGEYKGIEEFYGRDDSKKEWWMENISQYLKVEARLSPPKQEKARDLEVVALHLEPELVNGQLRLIMTTADGEKYVLSERTICPEGGQGQLICKKAEDWFFNPANKPKK